MTFSEERLKILQMLQDGTINADQAAKLLETLGSSAKKPEAPLPPQPPITTGQRGGKYFRVRVTDTDTGKTRVNVRLPVGLVGAGIKMGMKFAPEIEGIDPHILQNFLETGEIGQIVDVYDDEDGEHVEIFIE
jgi:hypothetical protein